MLKNALFYPLLAILVLSQPVFAQKISDQVLQQISALEKEKDSRNPAQKKMDSQLIYAGHKLAKGVASTAAPDMEPDVKIHPDGRVLVDITATVSDGVLNFIGQGGGQVINSFARYDAIRALIPLGKIEALAARGDVRFVARAHEATTNIGSVTGEGDICHRAAQARAAFGADGTGVRVGVLSDSATFYTNSQALGDLGPITILPGQGGSGSGEGTAMMEIIHDLAPGASLYFATAFASAASFAANINALVASNCNVIVDDVTYFVESPFQDGQPIAQAVKSASDAGVLYFSSARNSGNKDSGTSGTWEGDFNDGGAASAPLPTGRVHNFGGGTNYNVVTFIDSPRADLFWSDPLGGSTNDYDLYVLNSTGTSVARSSTTTQSGTQDPYEAVTTLIAGERIVIFKKTAAAARFLHLDTGRCEISINTAGNVRGHNSSSASNAFCVAAVDVHTSSPFPSPFVGGANNPVETFSSDGPRRIFFQPNGTAITPGNFSSTGGLVIQKPDITAADGASGSAAVPGFSPFYGTSAAAPHAAGVAALLKSYKPALTPAQLRAALTNSALDIMSAGYDRDSGPGLVMALHALASASGKPWLLSGALQLSGGNGNGTVDSNECNDLQFVLQNIGSATASNVAAALSTVTTGASVTQPATTYPNILPGDSATNSPPFKLSTAAGFVPGAPISLSLASSYTGGANTNTATLTTSQCPPIQTNAGLSVSSPTQSGRLGRDGVASGCDGKTCPGAFTTSARPYNAHSFTNASTQSVCVTATIATSCDPGGTSNILAVAYLGNFNSASLCTGYLGDPGLSPGPGGLSFAFSVPPLTNFTIVVHAITNGFFCPDYTLSVDGLICPGDGGGQCGVPTLTVTKAGAGSGLVTSTPAGINCGGTCVAGFASNSVVTLTATASVNSAFTGWTGDGTGTGSRVVTVDVNRAVTATFNAAPIVTGASVTGGFSDEPLAVTGTTTFDGDGDSVSLAYQWQFSTNGTTFADQSGATNATLLAGSGNLWRCQLTPSDAFNTGTNFLTGAIAVNNRPNLLGRHGQAYSYDSDLFLAASGAMFTRNALINEFSQGTPGGGNVREWVEILFLKSSDARNWKLSEAGGTTLTFTNTSAWTNVPAGTLLVVYNGGAKDTVLPADDTDPFDGNFKLVIAHSNSSFFRGSWISLNNSGGDEIGLLDAASSLIDGVSYGTNSTYSPQLAIFGTDSSANYTNNTEAGVDVAANWQIVSASSATPVAGNGTANSNFVAQIRSGAFNQMPLFQLGGGGDPVAGLSIDATNGLYSGTINAPTGGFYNVVIERYSGTNLVSQQYNLLVGDSNDVYRIPAGKTWAINTNYTIPGTLIVGGLLDTPGHTLVVSNTLDVSGGAVSNATGLIVYHKLVGSPLPGASSQFNALPAISAASVSPASPVDTDDLVANVTDATDVDGDPITFAYQWQESTNNIAFTTATLTNTATAQGMFYRCVITPNDGIADGSPFITIAVQIALDLQILSVESSNTDFVITYSAVSNKTYELQLATDLVLSNWNGIATNTPGNTGSAQFFDIGGLVETQRFYRIKLLP